MKTNEERLRELLEMAITELRRPILPAKDRRKYAEFLRKRLKEISHPRRRESPEPPRRPLRWGMCPHTPGNYCEYCLGGE